MPDRFDLERRAEELFPSVKFFGEDKRAALQLARELAEAIAAEIDDKRRVAAGGNAFTDGWNHGIHQGYKIARSFARPRSREDVYRKALDAITRRVILSGGNPTDAIISQQARELRDLHDIAQCALDEAEKVGQ